MIVFFFSLNMLFAGLVPDYNHDGVSNLADLYISQVWCEKIEQIKRFLPYHRRLR